MAHRTRRLALIAVVPFWFAVLRGGVYAQTLGLPGTPAGEYFGTVTVDGLTAPASSIITAKSLTGAACGSGVLNPRTGIYGVSMQGNDDCPAGVIFFVNGRRADQEPQPGYPGPEAVRLNLSVTASASTPAPSGVSVTYPSGWNLVAGPAGTLITGTSGPVYTFGPGDSSYVEVPPGFRLQPGIGYWAFFTTATTVRLPIGGPTSSDRSVPAEQEQVILVGNPFTTPAKVSGASAIYTFDAVRGYEEATILQPGQGAWAISLGGPIVITATER